MENQSYLTKYRACVEQHVQYSVICEAAKARDAVQRHGRQARVHAHARVEAGVPRDRQNLGETDD